MTCGEQRTTRQNILERMNPQLTDLSSSKALVPRRLDIPPPQRPARHVPHPDTPQSRVRQVQHESIGHPSSRRPHRQRKQKKKKVARTTKPDQARLTYNFPDDAHDLRLRENQPARLHGRLHPVLVPPLPHRPVSPPTLNREPVGYIRYPGHAALAPDSASDAGGLVQSDLGECTDAGGFGGTVQHVCAGARDHKLEYLSR